MSRRYRRHPKIFAQAFKIINCSWLTVAMKQQLEVYLSSLRDDPLEAAASITGSLASLEAE